jgi:hypothetical protein
MAVKYPNTPAQCTSPSVDKARSLCVVGQFGSAVKGHDFSRAAKAPKKWQALAPEGKLFFKLTRYQFLRLHKAIRAA